MQDSLQDDLNNLEDDRHRRGIEGLRVHRQGMEELYRGAVLLETARAEAQRARMEKRQQDSLLVVCGLLSTTAASLSAALACMSIGRVPVPSITLYSPLPTNTPRTWQELIICVVLGWLIGVAAKWQALRT